MVERRLVEINLNNEKYYHLDNVVDTQYVSAFEFEENEIQDDVMANVDEMDLLWSDEPLAGMPQDPDPEVDLLADAVELQRLQKMGVIEVLTPNDAGLSSLTTRMVYDWRIKDWTDPKTGQSRRRWMRRARLVAREYANHRRDDVHSPASNGQIMRLLPAIYLMMLGVEGVSQDQLQIGALDIKDAFLMASQEEPVQITTKKGKFKVLKNYQGNAWRQRPGMTTLPTSWRRKGCSSPQKTPAWANVVTSSSSCCTWTT